MAATGLAEVGARDSQPLEVPGSLQHALEQLAIVRLQLLALAQGLAPRRDPVCQRIADRLETTEVEGARRCRHGRNSGVNLNPGEGLDHQRRELPLEPADLPPQFCPRQTLVAADKGRENWVSLR
jgi:hypothetical protein